jgi:DNA-binding response OmpR family regulator
LVVEDDVLIRLSVGEFLRHANYRVLEASNADEARAILESREPVELVFTDVDMPGEMNGFELAQWVRRQYPDVGVLLTSGVENLGETRGYGREHGPVLRKPYALDLVLTHIKRLLLA